MDLAQFWFQAAGGGYQIGNSLRFRGAQYLRRTLPSGTLNSVQTYSAWVKLGSFDTSTIMARYIVSGTSELSLGYVAEGFAYNRGDTGEDTNPDLHKHRDPSAWYHVFSVCNGTNYQTWINGQVLGGYSGNANGVLLVPDRTLTIGRRDSINGSFLNGYLAEVHAIDGQLINISEFGEYNDDGVWVPKEVSGINYGTLGFYLDFSDPNDIGADRSGNGNDFTPTGFELTTTTSPNYDWIEDSPTDNYSTLNPITPVFSTGGVGGSAGSLDANLTEAVVSGASSTGAYVNGNTINIPANNTSQFYFEMTAVSGYGLTGSNHGVAFVPARVMNEGTLPSNYFVGIGSVPGIGAYNNGTLADYGTNTPGAFTALTAYGQTFQVEVDGLNVRVNTQGNLTAGQVVTFTLPSDEAFTIGGIGYKNHSNAFNFGQKPFKHSSPKGFKGLSTAGMPAVAITNPSDHFQVFSGGSQSGDADYIKTQFLNKYTDGALMWRPVAGSNGWYMSDTVRGFNNYLKVNSTNQEAAQTNPSNTGPAFGYGWSAPEAFTGSGTLTSSGRRNLTAGFSIVNYLSTGTPGTVTHGLPVAPEMIWLKRRDTQAQGWLVGSDHIPPNDWSYYLQLDTNGGRSAMGSLMSAPDSSNLNIGTGPLTNGSTPSNYIVYCWHSIPGYSAFGTYTGNNSADGPFIYTGFRPAFVIAKVTQGGTGVWFTGNIANSPYNPIAGSWRLNESSVTTVNTWIDITSNGFKFRGTDANGISGGTYLYMAFAEHPFGGSNVSPSPAR